MQLELQHCSFTSHILLPITSATTLSHTVSFHNHPASIYSFVLPLLTITAYLIELFPYAQRTRGIGIEQVFGKCGGFFSNNVNPVALRAIDWKFLAIYCGWIAFELLFIFFLYPETSGRTLEELAFCKCHRIVYVSVSSANLRPTVFEDKDRADKAVIAVEKQIHHEEAEKPAVTLHETADKAA